MSLLDRLRHRPPPRDEAAMASRREDVDPETGEILRDNTEDIARKDSRDRVRGERTVTSVNRERSLRTRVNTALAISAVVLLVGGFLTWYYASYFESEQAEQDAAAKAAEARIGGESVVPPLGRVDPPSPGDEARTAGPMTVADVLGPPPPAPPERPMMASGTQAASAKTPEQLALERKLNQPVMLRAPSAAPTGPPVAAHPAPPMGTPNLAAILGAVGGSADPDSPPTSNPALAELLKPTPTAAVSAQVLPTRRLLLPKGSFVDCTLETAIDSTLPGMVTCIGANDIYGADGKVVLLERGTKYVGETRGEVRQGQSRVFVLWQEARTPTGVVVQLASPGTDALGRSGLPGHVDTHFWDRFGAAILISVIDGGLQALAAHQQRDVGTAVSVGTQGTRDVMTEVLKSTIAIPPTILKNQGERVQVLAARDADFRSVYALRVDDEGR
jgi:type IV secretion system protein VirB10